MNLPLPSFWRGFAEMNILTVCFNKRQPILPIDEFGCFEVFFTVGSNESRLAAGSNRTILQV